MSFKNRIQSYCSLQHRDSYLVKSQMQRKEMTWKRILERNQSLNPPRSNKKLLGNLKLVLSANTNQLTLGETNLARICSDLPPLWLLKNLMKVTQHRRISRLNRWSGVPLWPRILKRLTTLSSENLIMCDFTQQLSQFWKSTVRRPSRLSLVRSYTCIIQTWLSRRW